MYMFPQHKFSKSANIQGICVKTKVTPATWVIWKLVSPRVQKESLLEKVCNQYVCTKQPPFLKHLRVEVTCYRQLISKYGFKLTYLLMVVISHG